MMPRSMKLFGHAILLSAAAVTFSLLGSPAQAQRSGPFANFNGNWAGGGTITLGSGAKERIRCRANYTVDSTGATLGLDLRCASDSYRFNLTASAKHSGGEISGIWSEAARSAGGTLSGSANGSRIEVRASGDTFSALITMNTTPSRQSILIESPGSELSSVSITLNKG